MDCMRSGFRAGRTRTDASSDTDKMLSETLTGTGQHGLSIGHGSIAIVGG